MISDVEVREVGDRGRGVVARRALLSGELVLRRRHLGRLSRAAVDALPDHERVHVCQVDVDVFSVVAPPGCYMNHSCEPNALRRGVDVHARRPIAAGEEVTLDYRLWALDGASWSCRCGAPSCSGVVEGGFLALPSGVQEDLLPFAAPFVRRERRRRTGQD